MFKFDKIETLPLHCNFERDSHIILNFSHYTNVLDIVNIFPTPFTTAKCKVPVSGSPF